jgi:hypothetical protein
MLRGDVGTDDLCFEGISQNFEHRFCGLRHAIRPKRAKLMTSQKDGEKSS